MTYLKANGTEYPATFEGRHRDEKWNYRESKSITLEMTYAEAAQLFTDGLSWAIVYRSTDADETGTVTENEEQYDNSDFCVAGAITDNRDGTITAKMGKRTDGDILAELEGAYDGN